MREMRMNVKRDVTSVSMLGVGSSRHLAMILVCCLVPTVTGRQAPAEPRPQPITTAVTAVVVDAVVRDGKNRPVTNLRREDFELLEDGVPQAIGDVIVVMPGSMATPRRAASVTTSSTGASTPGKEMRGKEAPPASPTFLALVFDRLSPDARLLAYKGALAYLETMRDNDYAAVFISDRSLETIQSYTNDRAKIAHAIREVSSRATTVFDRTRADDLTNRDRYGQKLPGDAHPDVPVVASAESEGRPVEIRPLSDAPGIITREIMALDTKTHMSWEVLTRDQQGLSTTNALLAVTSALGSLPGRKSVVFFAEGLAIPETVLPHFRSVVTTANRGNVSVYTIDAAGLRVHSKDGEIGREITAMGNAGLTLNEKGENLTNLAMLERNEDVLRKDPRTSLTLLAEETGGFLLENTNDLAGAFRQIDADRRFHYLLTYTPKNTAFDGSWRAITVKVPNRSVTVRARSGYLAVPPGGTLPLLAYEGPALAALTQSPAPAELPLRLSALVFPEGSRSRVAVLAETDANALRFGRDPVKHIYRAEANIVTRIVDAQGRVVQKLSQPYRIAGPEQQMDDARRGNILFFRQPMLGPGTYTLEAALHDVFASKMSVRRSTFVVPNEPDGLQVSSLVLVRQSERVPPQERAADNPLYVGDVLLYPRLGEPIRASQHLALTLFVAVSSAAGTAPTASLELVRGTEKVAQGPMTLSAPDASGKIRHVAQVPIDALAPGGYTLRLIVDDGQRQVTRTAEFELIR
jgi:VWFA-related protein